MALPVTDSASVGVAFPILSRVLTLSQWGWWVSGSPRTVANLCCLLVIVASQFLDATTSVAG
jgi:hypothetical protein